MNPADQRVTELVDKWVRSLELHLKYVALTDEAYWQVQPWAHHQRPARWILDLAQTRARELKRQLGERIASGDTSFAEALELMAFLANLVGVQNIERFIPLAELERENAEALGQTHSTLSPLSNTSTQTRTMLEPTREMRIPEPPPAPVPAPVPAPRAAPPPPPPPPPPSAVSPRFVPAPPAPPPAPRAAPPPEPPRAAPPLAPQSLPPAPALRATQAPPPPPVPTRAAPPAASASVPKPQAPAAPVTKAAARGGAKRETRTSTGKHARAASPSASTPPPPGSPEAQVIADAVRLLKWGRQWHELPESIARTAGRPGVVEVRKCLRSYKAEIEKAAAE